MRTANLLKAITKAGLTLTTDGMRHHVRGTGDYYGGFFDQEGRVACLSTCHVGDKPDSMTDYFPQTYHDTIKGFIYWMQYKHTRASA